KIAESDLKQFGKESAGASGTALSGKTLNDTFDYAIEGVAVPADPSSNEGNAIAIVMPLESPLAANSTFHKYNPDKSPQWRDFSLDAKNTIEWADAISTGICPTPDENVATTIGNYVNNTPQVGKTCLQITIQDGGANDQDGAINGVIVDPFGIATPTPIVNTGGGSSTYTPPADPCANTASITSSSFKEQGSCDFINYFVLKLDPVLAIDASVDYQTRDGSAKAGEDYVASSGTVVMRAGQTQLFIPITIIADNFVEDDETFDLVLSRPTGTTFPSGVSEIVATHTIINTDTAYAITPTGVVAEVSTTEGSSNHINYFQLALDKIYDHDVIVSYRTEDGTAIAGKDYIATSRKVKITAGKDKVMIGVEIIADTIKESDETFSLVISNPIGENFTQGINEMRATHTIVDDD
ncbi:MAG: hypothetical protein KAG86_06695, partial [Gammaproteobacteria bacterium]|nr:hypothetical protein [Gammaproteobacteria bacterium]